MDKFNHNFDQPIPNAMIKKPKILQKTLEDYYHGRMDEKSSELHDDEYKGIAYSAATENEKARREIECLDNQLMKARNEWVKEKAKMDERWKVATAKHNEVFEDICEFNQGYREHFLRRDRLYHDYLQEKSINDEKDIEIRCLQKQVARLKEIKKASEDRLKIFSPFKTYLIKMLEGSDGKYEDIREVIDFHNQLEEERDEQEKKNVQTKKLIKKRARLKDIQVIRKSNEIMAYRNYLTELEDYKDVILLESQRLDDNLLRIKTTSAHRTKIIGQIKLAVDNVYKQICKSMHHPARITHEDTLGQLNAIGVLIKETNNLTKDIKRMLKAAFATAEAEKQADLKVQKKENKRKMLKDPNSQKQDDASEIFGLITPGPPGGGGPKTKAYSTVPQSRRGGDLLRVITHDSSPI